MRIRVRIDRVVLDELPLASRDIGRFETALHAQLLAGLAAPGAILPQGSVRERRIVASPVALHDAGSAAELGTSVGRSIGAAVSRSGPR